jgi:lipopolysaccharide export system protein LptA
MTRSTTALALAALFSAVGFAALAAGQPTNAAPGIDSKQPIAVNADNFVADLNSETGLYTGNVIVTQGSIRLHADRVKVSAPGGKASRMEADGHVVVDSPSGQAIGDTGVYEVAEQILRLKGNVVLTKDANVMRGSDLEVSMATGMAHLTGGGTAIPNQPAGRVQGLFTPAPNPNAAAPPSPPATSGNPPKS